MKLTIVICSHNRWELLKAAIDSINAADRPDNHDITILVIANACTDNTVIELEKYQAKQLTSNFTPLFFAEEVKIGKSYALNYAVRLIKDGYLCFMDDDQRVDRNYFVAIIKALDIFSEATMLCGPLFPDWIGNEPNWIHETGKYRVYPLPVPFFDLGNIPLKIIQETQTPPGGQVIIRRDVFNRIGLFSEKLGPMGHNLMGSEDTEFFLRAIENNESFHYIPSIIQYHYVDANRLKLGYLLKNSFQRNRSLTMTHHPDTRKTPLYLWSKLLNYIFGAIFSFKPVKIRFYLLRCAGILGQITGHIQKI